MYKLTVTKNQQIIHNAFFKMRPEMPAIVFTLSELNQAHNINLEDLTALMEDNYVDIDNMVISISSFKWRNHYTGKEENPTTYRNSGSLGGNHDMPSRLEN